MLSNLFPHLLICLYVAYFYGLLGFCAHLLIVGLNAGYRGLSTCHSIWCEPLTCMFGSTRNFIWQEMAEMPVTHLCNYPKTYSNMPLTSLQWRRTAYCYLFLLDTATFCY